MAIIHWIWPPTRCQNCQSIYSSSLNLSNNQNYHTNDSRFSSEEDDGVMVENKRLSINSQYSSSDDGGFLPKRPRIPCTSWRRPFIYCPSELSFRSDGQHSNKWLGLGRNLLQTIPQLHQPPVSSVPITQNLHINTISASAQGSIIPSSNLYTPSSRLSRIHASSPATSSPMINSPWSPLYFSDLSSVYPSSAERSQQQQQQQQPHQRIFSPTRQSYTARATTTNNNNRYNHRYINELPALRTLHEEQEKLAQGFVPVQDSPPIKSYYANIGPSASHYRSTKSSYKTFPRYNRMLRAVPELSSPILNLNLNILEQSPESQSSSGFGSKNNSSSQQNQSSQSGGTVIDWRIPPYRPPPQPSSLFFQRFPFEGNHGIVSPSSPLSMSHWFEIMQRLNLASANEFKAVDVGSVDGHYEFDHYDPSSPTPTVSTPTQQHHHQQVMREESNDLIGTLKFKRQLPILPPPPTFHYQTRYDQARIDARVQAMKEEFYLYRKKQAIKRAGIVLESAC